MDVVVCLQPLCLARAGCFVVAGRLPAGALPFTTAVLEWHSYVAAERH